MLEEITSINSPFLSLDRGLMLVNTLVDYYLETNSQPMYCTSTILHTRAP